MKKLTDSFGKLKKREKALLVLALIVCAALAVNKFIISPAFKSLSVVSDKYESKSLLLSKYYDFLSNEEYYNEKLKSLENEFKNLERKILHLETEELASAKLQELAKKIAKRHGLSISRSIGAKNRVITEDPYLVSISANFEINDIGQTQKLRAFIYDLEYNKDKLFFVNDLRVKSVGLEIAQGISLSTNLALIAYIRKK